MEPAATLTDTLLDDLDDLSDVEETVEEETSEKETGDNRATNGGAATATKRTTSSVSPAYVPPKRKRLLDDPGLQAHLDAIRKISSNEIKTASKEQEEEEHRLILLSNKHLSNLAQELTRAHGDLCSLYRPKFPELEELVVDPIKYKNAVKVIWNEMDMTKVNDPLNEFLNSNQIITISVSGSTTSGRPLSEEELKAVGEASEYMEQIADVQVELTRFVESRMESLAPSVCALVGPSTAAKLLGLAGGLAELSKIPACNLQVLGQTKQNAASRAGLSSVASKPHMGVLAETDLVRQVPSYLQKKVLKVVAAKLALAARCDFINVDTGRTRSAASGEKFRQEIKSKINSWEEPDKARVVKPLPK
jgi:U4/U6 small nuclear ribonucleoprotein PRP31